MNQSQSFVKISEELFKCKIEGNHLIVLLAICMNFSYWKENRVNKISVPELAEKCGKSAHAVYQSLRYLRQNNFLIKLGRNEYINPLVCYRCSESVRRDIISNISESMPSYNQKVFNFKDAEAAKELDEQVLSKEDVYFPSRKTITADEWATSWEEVDDAKDEEVDEEAYW
jgi:hypothetical protein